jgi:hypothetical protein
MGTLPGLRNAQTTFEHNKEAKVDSVTIHIGGSPDSTWGNCLDSRPQLFCSAILHQRNDLQIVKKIGHRRKIDYPMRIVILSERSESKDLSSNPMYSRDLKIPLQHSVL